ncbi:hypothetical protein GUITHDRAFT_154681 [Guillardia theta CCMP2712]|uniref:Uncharacterized protein n=1 Tax=Guillardia theta (strain CCMP2712) TaxID=905079 RepID=L1IQJ2_GUITC|nr:hypothetical protein GUITHDRAFT_154681 [Guillardia theta CCMP2712]EKX38523.1 hypothetical protein GUITHDRAFT_154681 [Guillardia theta CCMP2712]|eukprot:XP_005825503.1 hypothetical protein GUITHDRAFT_154681 [Guillardia theta CCMP2712]
MSLNALTKQKLQNSEFYGEKDHQCRWKRVWRIVMKANMKMKPVSRGSLKMD